MKKILILLISILTLFCISGSTQTLSTYVTAPDGVLLATDVYLPLFSGASPSILIRTTYDKNDLSALCTVFNFMGYACVAQDTRGRYASGGIDTVFHDDGPDGRATLEWIKHQWWSSGSVATIGASALGITQYALAPGASDALKCMMPIVATPDPYHHAFIQGGCLRSALVYNWLEGQDSLDFLDEILSHRLWDAWWQEVDPLGDPASINVPALHIGGWYDIFAQGTLDAFTTYQHEGGTGARGHQHLVMGPWTHTGMTTSTSGELTYPANAIYNFIDAAEDWLDDCLKGSSDDLDQWPPVRIYVMGAVGEAGAPGNIWLDLEDWPPLTSSASYFLSEDNGLGTQQPVEGTMILTINPEDPVPTLGGANLFPDLIVDGRTMGNGPMDQRSIEAREDVFVFTSDVLSTPLTVIGKLRAQLWIVADTPDLDLSIRLSDVYPDGRSMLVTDGIQRARMRCGDDQECFLEPGTPTLITVDLWSTAIVFNTGHRIRISISGSNAPRFEVNPNDGRDLDTGTPVVARPTLLFGPDYPSALELPVMPPPRRVSGRH